MGVLILVVVDNGLVQHNYPGLTDWRLCVLILVVVDNGLVLIMLIVLITKSKCLNPCCSGQWSRTGENMRLRSSMSIGLNPCCSGQWSRTYYD